MLLSSLFINDGVNDVEFVDDIFECIKWNDEWNWEHMFSPGFRFILREIGIYTEKYVRRRQDFNIF